MYGAYISSLIDSFARWIGGGIWNGLWKLIFWIWKLILRYPIKTLIAIGIIALVTIAPKQCSGTSGKEKAAGQTQARTQTVRQAQGYAYVNSDGLNMRSGPSAQSAIVTVLRRNNRVQLVETANGSGNWVKIRSGNHEGFVNADFLKQ